MGDVQKEAYFDELSSRWDGFTDHDQVRATLRIELDRMDLAPDEHVVDLGCGTGNLTAVLLEKLGPGSVITAVDFSAAMIEKARGKFPDPRVRWCRADSVALPLTRSSCDRVICFSAWPHFPHPPAVLLEMNRVLRDGSVFTILHINGRATINQIHSSAAQAIVQDLLPPAADVAALFPTAGFVVEECEDSLDRYCITGRKLRNHS